MKYVFSNEPYAELTMLEIAGNTMSDFPLVEGDELNVPNLEILIINGNIFHQTWKTIMDGNELHSPYSEVLFNPESPGYNHSIITCNKLNVPNLRYLQFYGKFSYNLFINKPKDFINAPELEELYFHGTEITEIPACLINTKTLKRLTLRSENIIAVPDFVYDCENLEGLHLQHTPGITVIPEKIKNLVNLQWFDLWQSSIKYLSPELFLLPKLKHLGFAFSSYNPTPEVLRAAQVFTKGRDFGWPSGPGSDGVEVLTDWNP